MKNTDECKARHSDVALKTLPLCFTTCSEDEVFEDENAGKSLFLRFIRDHSGTAMGSSFAKAMSNIKFGGYIHDPPTIVLRGTSKELQSIRLAWSKHLLKAPPGYHINYVGDITSSDDYDLMKDNAKALDHAICSSIANVTSKGAVATQEAILLDLTDNTHTMHPPSREVLHGALGKLIRNRKVFCTGPGYHLVTTGTYAEKPLTDSEEKISKNNGRRGACSFCEKNRKMITHDSRSKVERKSSRDKKSNSDTESQRRSRNSTSLTSNGSDIRQEYYCYQHGKNMEDDGETNRENRRIPSKKSSRREKRLSIVEKMTEKFFRRPRPSSKSNGNRSASGFEFYSTKKETDKNPVRYLDECDAIRLGYEVYGKDRTYCHRSAQCDQNRSRSHVKRPSSFDRKAPHTLSSDKSEKSGVRQTNKITREEKTHCVNNGVPDLIPDMYRKNTSNKAIQTDDCGESATSSLNNSPRDLNDYDIDCYDSEISCSIGTGQCPPRFPDTIYARPESVSPRYIRNTPRRVQSMRLPRVRRTENFDRTAPPSYGQWLRGGLASSPLSLNNSNHSEKRYSYNSLGNSSRNRRIARTVSRPQPGRDLSYIHSCHYAPSVRIGSVIADHLQEMDRRRKHWSFQSDASRLSWQKYPDYTTVQHEERQDEGDHDYKNIDDDEATCVGSEESTTKRREMDLDPETAAALNIAKRLAELDIKMTRKEWEEYFTLKILPDQVEDLLKEAKGSSTQSALEEDEDRTYFEKACGSVETVIDTRQNERKHASRRSHSSRSSAHKSHFSCQEEQVHCDKTSDEEETENDDGYSFSNNCYEQSRTNYSSTQSLSNGNHHQYLSSHENYEPRPAYVCDMGYNHLGRHDYQRQQALHTDNSSLTEDSGFHSSRERYGQSTWQRTKTLRGTFV